MSKITNEQIYICAYILEVEKSAPVDDDYRDF